jgi:hypothetical protein
MYLFHSLYNHHAGLSIHNAAPAAAATPAQAHIEQGGKNKGFDDIGDDDDEPDG